MDHPAMLDSAILSASEYNRIPRFEEQTHSVPVKTLRALGRLFLDFGLEEDYCLALLHRHFDLDAGQVLIHHSDSLEDVCRPFYLQEVDEAALVPNSIFLNGNFNFQPYEYELGTKRHPLDTGFLDRLRSLLLAEHLDLVLAVTTNPGFRDTSGPAVESLLPDSLGMHTLSFNIQRNGNSRGGSVITTWAFSKDDVEGMKIRAIKACVKNLAGIHEPKDSHDRGSS